MTSKSGPNGHALRHSIQDLISLPDELLRDISVLGGEKLSLNMHTLKFFLEGKNSLPRADLFPEKEPGSIRKLCYFPDKELKVRVIAQLDYWSQTGLRALHHYLFRALKRIRQDCTFNQGNFKNLLKDQKYFYSIDLKACTDRFPIDFQCQVLSAVLPHHYVSS